MVAKHILRLLGHVGQTPTNDTHMSRRRRLFLSSHAILSLGWIIRRWLCLIKVSRCFMELRASECVRLSIESSTHFDKKNLFESSSALNTKGLHVSEVVPNRF